MSGFISCAYKTWKQREAEAAQRRALVWAHLIYAGINVLWDFMLIFLARLSHGSSLRTCVSLHALPWPGLNHRGGLLGLSEWPFLILPLWQIQSSQNWGHSHYSRKSIWEYTNISLLPPALQGCGRFLFQSSGWLAVWPDSFATSSVPVCACMPLTQFCQNSSLPNIIYVFAGTQILLFSSCFS